MFQLPGHGVDSSTPDLRTLAAADESTGYAGDPVAVAEIGRRAQARLERRLLRGVVA